MSIATRCRAASFALLWAAMAACGVPPCPKGYDQKGDTCYHRKDAGTPSDAASGNPSDLDAGHALEDSAADALAVEASDGAHAEMEAGPGPAHCESGAPGCASNDAQPCVEHGACCEDRGCACATTLACGCQNGFKVCRTECVAVSACCEDRECPTGSTCAGGACKAWCETQRLPPNIAEGDYRCLDFDQGLPSTDTWKRSVDDAGALEASSARAFSAPASLLADNATLSWSLTGAEPLSGIAFSAMVSPAGHPTVLPGPLDVAVLTLAAGDQSSGDQFELALHYTYEGSLLTVQGEIPKYSGLYIRPFNPGGAFIPNDLPLYATSDGKPLDLAPNIWSSLAVDADADGLNVTVDDKQATVPNKLFGGDTNGGVRFGSSPLLSSSGLKVQYDNVVISARRGQ